MSTRPLVLRLTQAALALQVLLVVSGTAVRVTGSGLGCPTWPRCTGTSITNTAALGSHGFIEFGNRLLAVVLEVVGLALVLAVRRLGAPRTWRRLALTQAMVVPLQAVVGGLLVLSGLNPYVLIAHFLASFPLILAAAALLRRVLDDQRPGRAAVVDPTGTARWLTRALVVASSAVLMLGTLVTGTGPHAGSPDIARLPFDPRDVTQLHADLVYLLVGLVLATALVTRRTPLWRWSRLLLALVVAQAGLGYWQYFTSVPPVLVALHVLGAALVFTTAAWAALSARPADAPLPRTAPPLAARPAGTATAR